MSVKVCDRNLSKMEVVWHATEIKDLIHGLCIRTFGIRDYNSFVRSRMSAYADPKANQSSYVYLMFEYKKRLNYLVEDLISSARVANGIRMSSARNCDRRLEYQERTLSDCEMLIGKLQDVANTFDVDLNRFRPSVEAIDREITLLKGWIRYTKKMKQKYS